MRRQQIAKLISSRSIYLIGLNLLSIGLLYAIVPPFRNIPNMLYMLKYTGTIGFCALGESMVILAGGGGIDLSVGSVLGLTGVILYFLSKVVPLWTACLLCLPIGAVLGALNGALVTRFRFPPFIVTLGTMFLYSGIALGISKGVAYSGFPKAFGVLGNGVIFYIPIQLLLFIVVFGFLYIVQFKTAFGLRIMAVGSNEHSARLLGIRPERLRLILYSLSGMLAATSAIIMVSWLLTARPDAGAGYELRAIAAAVLGGIDLQGGAGSVFGVFLAVVFIVILQTGLQLVNINPVWQLGALGILLVLVALTSMRLSITEKGGRSWRFFWLVKAG